MTTSTAAAEMPRLTGVIQEAGECDRCHRELGRVYEVTDLDGTVATYGRRCCAKVTGYRGDLERAVRMARRALVMDARKATLAAAGCVLVDPVREPADWFGWEVATNDRLWDGHDADGREPLPFQRWQTWKEALTARNRRGCLSPLVI